jgi:glycosyltransferase involved in cell wall biosynthesis
MKKILHTVKNRLQQEISFHEAKGKIGLVEAVMFTEKEWAENAKVVEHAFKGKPRSIAWFIPYFTHVYFGGIYTIFRFAHHFEEQGVKNYFFFYGIPPADKANFQDKQYAQVLERFPKFQRDNFIVYEGPDVNSLPEADYAVATFWTSAYLLLKYNKAKRKLYFAQDAENLFYPASGFNKLVQMTYGFGFDFIVNSKGVYDYLKEEFNIKGVCFIPSVDALFQHKPEDIINNPERKKLKFFFFGRPNHERNGFELGLPLLKAIKQAYPEAEFLTAGAPWKPADYGIDFVTNLGLLKIEETAELYKTCDYGLVLMFTPHTSYIPLELMSSGTILITNTNKYTKWLFENRKNSVYVDPIPYHLCQEIAFLENNPAAKQNIRAQAKKDIDQYEWEKAFHVVDTFLSI